MRTVTCNVSVQLLQLSVKIQYAKQRSSVKMLCAKLILFVMTQSVKIPILVVLNQYAWMNLFANKFELIRTKPSQIQLLSQIQINSQSYAKSKRSVTQTVCWMKTLHQYAELKIFVPKNNALMCPTVMTRYAEAKRYVTNQSAQTLKYVRNLPVKRSQFAIPKIWMSMERFYAITKKSARKII